MIDASVACYSARFISPFAQVLSTYECFDPESLRKLKAIDPGGRISTTVANDLAIRQVALTGDPDLGLKAARAMPLGAAGPLDYAIQSAATVRQSVVVADRYIRAFSDVLNVRVAGEDSRALIKFEMSVPAPRAIIDFTMSAWYANHIRPSLAGAPGLECWFSHPRPSNTTEYERAFAGAPLRFEAPSCGFAFDRDSLDAPLPSADASVHALLCEHVQLTLDQATQRPTLTGRVREITSKELLEGAPSIFTVARQLRMSPRTLARRLEREGTTFSAVFDSLRQELAVRYVARRELAFTDIAFRLRFAHVEGFYRAFRRWTGRTPLTYRRAYAESSPRAIWA